MQDPIANATEDIIWAVWFMGALIMARCSIRLLLVPVVMYYFMVHIPCLFAQLSKPSEVCAAVVDELGEDGAWVVTSVIIKAILYFIFLSAHPCSS